jgi:tetratricopeptide (TPR) repeat protein
MYDFVEQYAGAAPKNSPLKLLNVDLYADLLNFSSMECLSYKSDKDKMSRCITSVMERTIRPELEEQVQAAFRLYDHADRYQFGIAVKPILAKMLEITGGETYSGAVLQWAADGMHSNTQLVETAPISNDYIIDLAVADSWYNKGFYDNSLKKSEEALKDLQATSFPSGEEKDLTIAKIYTSISKIYGKLGSYAQMIAYDEAAIALGGRNEREHSICYGYYQLRQFDEALPACARVLEINPENLSILYWRGQLYRDLGRTADALKDLEHVADSQHGFRQSAAIDMSMIYFNQKDTQKALQVLNNYTYLYDPNVTEKDDVAVAYNNRCYAYMELGHLRKALDDCTASLKFGSLPDAYHKQEELVKRLGADRTQL